MNHQVGRTLQRERVSFEVKEHRGGSFQVRAPRVGEAGHGGTVDDTMISGPAHAHHVGFDQLTTGIEPRKDLHVSEQDGNGH